MIKVNELRYKNLFILNGLVSEVAGFHPNDKNSDDAIVFYTRKSVPGDSWKPINAQVIDPIPLTPEWLERCGFEMAKEEDGNSYLSYSILKLDGVIAKQEDGWYHMITDVDGYHEQNVGMKLEFVHQLQNRYQSFTGEELNVML